jgi:D-tyrosyl-tRNA(Tyr) deacylase
MRACVQRVTEASVTIGGGIVGRIGPGALVLLGVDVDDEESDARQLAQKIVDLRIFDDEQGKMNRSLEESGGSVLVVSQFTLLGDCRKGRRPSFTRAAPPEKGEQLYESFVTAVRARGLNTETGRFRAMMQVSLVNDGPVTMLLDSKRVW